MLVIEHACNLVCVHMHNEKKNNIVVNSHNETNVIGATIISIILPAQSYNNNNGKII